MSLEDLQEAGVLLPESEWGERPLDSTFSRPGLVATGALAIAAGVAMFLGGGHALTWIGAGVFLADLLGFTWLAWRAADEQNERANRRP